MPDLRFITPDDLAEVAIGDIDDTDSLYFYDKDEPIVAARLKAVTIGSLRDAVAIGMSFTDPVFGGTVTINGQVYGFPSDQSVGGLLRTDGAGALTWDDGYYTADQIDAQNAITVSALAGKANVGDSYLKAASDVRYAPMIHNHVWGDITVGKPTTLGGYGITDGVTPTALAGALAPYATIASVFDKAASDARYAAIVHTHGWGSITGTPTTLGGYGITDAYTKVQHDSSLTPYALVASVYDKASSDARYATIAHTQAFSTITGLPTTLAGYGITDAATAAGVTASLATKADVATTYTRVASDARFAQLATTLAGYGIADAYTQTQVNSFLNLKADASNVYDKATADARFAPIVHTHTWASIVSGTPTTLGGYGITDAYTKTQVDGSLALKADTANVYDKATADARYAAAAHTHSFASLTAKPTTLAGYGITDTILSNPLTADLLFTDNLFDIGKLAATRPRDLFLSRNLNAIGTLTLGGLATLGSLTVTGAANLSTAALTGALSAASVSTTGNATIGGTVSGTHTGDGSGLTGINANALSAGTVNTARLSGIYAGITGIGTVGSDLLFTDGLFDIGKLGATRPRDLWLSRNATVSGTIAAGLFSGSGASLTSIPFAALVSTPTTLAGYGIADAYTITNANAAFVSATGYTAGQIQYGQAGGGVAKRTLLGGSNVSITEAAPNLTIAVNTFPWASLTGIPTTLAGHGITDAAGLGANTFTGNQTAPSHIATGQGFAHSASKGVFAFASGHTQFWSYGASPSLVGDFQWLDRSSDGSLGGTRMSLTTVALTLGAGILADADSVYDIGASGVSRFRDMFLGRNLSVAGASTFVGGILVSGGAFSTSTLFTGATFGLGMIGRIGSVADFVLINNPTDGFNVFDVPTRTVTTRWYGNLLAFADGGPDLGGAGVNRFRDLNITRNVNAGGAITAGGAISATASPGTLSGTVYGLSVNTRQAALTAASSYPGSGAIISLINTTGNTGFRNWGIASNFNVSGALELIVSTTETTDPLGSLTGTSVIRWLSSGHMVAPTDSVYDIGQSGSQRWRDLWLSRNASVLGTLNVSGISHFGAMILPGNANSAILTRNAANTADLDLMFSDTLDRANIVRDLVTQNILPRFTSAVDIGAVATPWRSAYFSGQMNIGTLAASGNATFNGGATFNSAAQALVLINTTGGTVTDAQEVIFERGGNAKWRIGNNITATNIDLFEIYNEGVASALTINKTTNLVGVAGVMSSVGGFRVLGNTGAGANTLYADGSAGVVLWGGAGSATDLLFTNSTGQTVLDNPHGTTTSRFFGNVIAGTDNAFDIGTSGGARFRDAFLVRKLQIGPSANAGIIIQNSSGHNAPFLGNVLSWIGSGSEDNVALGAFGDLRFYPGNGTVSYLTIATTGLVSPSTFELTGAGAPVYLHSANGNRWAVSVSNAGALIVTPA